MKNNFKQNNSIIAIGDSHTDILIYNKCDSKIQIYGDNLYNSIWFNYYNNCFVYHISSATAYNTLNPKAKIATITKVKFLLKNKLIPRDAIVLCSFGEVDCRVHIKKLSERQNCSTENIIDNAISNYIKFLLYLKKHSFKVIAYGPIPSQSDTITIDDKFPRYGSEIERNNITKLFNQKLESACKANNIGFITLFDKLINDDMTTKKEFLNEQDNVHLGTQSYYLIEELLQKIKKMYA